MLTRTLLPRIVFLALIAASVGSTAAHAGVQNDAKNLVEKTAKTAVKNFAAQLKAREKQLSSATIDLLTQKAKSGIATTGDMYSLYTALRDFQVDVLAIYRAAFAEMGAGLHAAMEILDNDGVLVADYPRGFRYGEMGVLESFPNDLNKAMNARYNKLRKKLDKLSLKLKDSDVGLCVRLEGPSARRELNPTAFSVGGTYTTVPLTLDLLVAYSNLTIDQDGIVIASGSADVGANNTLTRSTPGSANWYYDILADNAGRWAHISSSLYERGYTFRVYPKNGGTDAINVIGIR